MNIALGLVSLALSILSYQAAADISIPLPWFLILLLVATLSLWRMYRFAHKQYLENQELSNQLKVPNQEVIPRVIAFKELPTIRLVASKSPLFIPNLGVTVILRDEVYPDDETILCHGIITPLYTNDRNMEITIDDKTMQQSEKNRIREIFADRNYHSRLFIIPGKIPEQQQ